MVNLSRSLNVGDTASNCVKGFKTTETNAVDTLGKRFHASHASHFPFLKKEDIVSHPV